MTPQTQAVFRSYRAQRTATRRSVAQSVHRTYVETVDPDEIVGSFAKTATRVAPAIADGQLRTATQTGAFLRQLATVQVGSVVEPILPALAGLTEKGLPLVEGMAALGPMVLGSISDGMVIEDALAFGDFLFTRFADAEVTRVADEVIEAQPRTRVVGWEGVVAPNACPECQANSGLHGMDEQMYRHPACFCERVLVYG